MRSMSQVKKKPQLISTARNLSPLSLLFLVGCGADTVGDGSISSGATRVSGNVVNGPLNNALVGFDCDGYGCVPLRPIGFIGWSL